MSSRRFIWTSSSHGDPARLATLQERMDAFYRRPDARAAYQRYIDKREVESFDHPFERTVAEYLAAADPRIVLEVGCGSGRFFRTLRRAGFRGKYAGTEVAASILRECSRRHPEATWLAATAYQIPMADASIDACFSYGVIESLVYPERALGEMIRVLSPRGRLTLLFPDFVESGRLGSQQTGLSSGRATAKLTQGRWIDAAFIAEMAEKGVSCRFHFAALHTSPMGRKLHDGRSLPHAEKLSDCLVRLPLYFQMPDGDVEPVVLSAIEVLRNI